MGATTITLDTLKSQEQDYFRAHWEGGELLMEPYCRCGNALEEDYFCKRCNRQCQCTSFVCGDEQTLAVVEKFLHRNPSFREFKSYLLKE